MTVAAKFGDACKVIVPRLGPYAGQRIAVSDEEADHAIEQGWADDPAEAGLAETLALMGRGPRPKLLTEARMLELAIAAAARWPAL